MKRNFQNMTLGAKQKAFTLMVAELISHIYLMGYTASFGDAYRDPRVFGEQGVSKNTYSKSASAHKHRLAIDLNIFKGGTYLTRTEHYKFAGEYWESLGGTWGGRFNDGNHFSVEHIGIK